MPSVQREASYDVVVLGTGAAGMSTAVFAGLAGLKTLVLEHQSVIGGTTALSAGTIWAPNNFIAQSLPQPDNYETALHYLDQIVGDNAPRVLREQFLKCAPLAIHTLHHQANIPFRARPLHPDYHTEVDGAVLTGRAIETLPFDGRILGKQFSWLSDPIREFTVLGGMMVDRDDIQALLNPGTHIKHCSKILLRHLIDRLSHKRGTRLVMGQALIARLLHACRGLPVNFKLEAVTSAIEYENGTVIGMRYQHRGREQHVKCRHIVLAGGGFNHSATLRSVLLPAIDMQWCPGSAGNKGTTQALAKDIGAVYGESHHSYAFWAPVSTRTRANHSKAVFPHFVMDRGKPGMITVNQQGKRFVNEATSYHLFGLAMQKAAAIPAYLICDAGALRRYGLGMIRPGASQKALQEWVNKAYLYCGDRLEELARQLAIDPAGLNHTVEQFNLMAIAGTDTLFQRGSTAYQNANGDKAYTSEHGLSNPNLAPLTQAPYYAVKLYPGDIGAATGLACNQHAQVLNAAGEALNGLYACGNDMHSIMGGHYPGPGITLGPAITFAYVAIEHIRHNT